VRTLCDLIECLLLSSEEPEPPPGTASSGAGATSSASNASCAALVAVETAPAAKVKPALDLNPQGFKKRSDAESKRQEQVDQLQAARAAQRAQYVENPQGPAPPPAAPDAKANGYPSATSDAAAAKKKANGTAFGFSNRGKQEQERNAAANTLQEMRKAQKDKFKEFQSDPNAKNHEAYKAPPSVAPGAQEDQSWGGFFGGMFGGGSSSSGQSKPDKPERRGPRIKGVADLPKPVQRGG
jgi:hypothetical protein